MPCHHLTEQERYVICHMRWGGFSPAAIGRELGRHRATIGRELKQNRSPFGQAYYYDTAAQLARERRDRANRRYKLDGTSGDTSGDTSGGAGRTFSSRPPAAPGRRSRRTWSAGRSITAPSSPTRTSRSRR